MKALFTKIVDGLKIIALFVKAVIKKVMKFFARTIYIILAIGYIGALGTAYYAQDTVKEYNQMAMGYAKKADDSYRAYESVKNIDKLDDILEDKLKAQYKVAEKNISNSVKGVNEKKLAKELLFGTKIEDTSLVTNIKSEIKKSFDIDIKAEINNILKQQKSNDSINTTLELLSSGKIVFMVLLLLSFPFLSPIVLGAVVLTIMSKKYLKHFSNPNEANYITMVPSTYIVNLILALVSVGVFYFNQNIGLAIAGIAHLLFIWKLFNGILLRKMDECLSCGQKFPDELEEIKKIKAKKA
tara:strand:- start:489 stop:1382 length:894 start_codon:yes stop_codon:yes gene_type:complete